MRALKHQINPHFLYNTLENVYDPRRWCAGMREAAEAITQWAAFTGKVSIVRM